MKTVESFQLLNNEFSTLRNMESEIQSLINKEGEVASDLNEIKKIEKTITSRRWQQQVKFLNSYQKLIEILKPTQKSFLFLSLGIFIELKRFHIICSNILRLIKTIKIKIPKSNLFERPLNHLDSLLSYSNSLQNVIQETWKWEIPGNDVLKEDYVRIFEKSITFPEYLQPSQIWSSFMQISNPKIVVFGKFQQDFLIFKEFSDINNWLISYKEQTKNNKLQSLSLNELSHSCGSFPNFSFQFKNFLHELFYFLFHSQILKIEENQPKLSAKESKKLQRVQEEKLFEYLGCYFIDLAANQNLNLNDFQFQAGNIKQIQHQIPTLLHHQQDNFLKKFEGDLNETSKFLQDFSNSLFDIINKLEEWISEYKTFILCAKNAMKSVNSILGQIRGDIAQFVEDFDHYVQSVKQNKAQIELEKKIEQAHLELESLLRNYQMETIPVIESSFPDFSQLTNQISQYKEKFIALQEKMNSLFEEYQKRNIEILPIMENWNKKFESITNQASFTIRNTLSAFIDKYRSVVQSEQEFFETLLGYNSSEATSVLNPLDIIQPEKMSEAEVRKQIEKIDKKLQKIENIKDQYLQKREKLSARLEELLKDHGLESKKCVICHQLVNVAEDNFIKCEFCGSLSHYTCAVWWIEKYNSCPVCHNKYTIPNNELFDPNQMER